jgi:hypothetical protein
MLPDIQTVAIHFMASLNNHSVAPSHAPVVTPSATTNTTSTSSFSGSLSGAGVVLGALIAAGVGIWTSRFTTRNQREITACTLKEQRKSFRKTLAHQRVQVLNERFAVAADKLGHAQPSTRLAGVYAMAALADDWKSQRQACIEVLCAYLRLPYEPNPTSKRYREGEREIRRTIIRIIRDHLRPGYTKVLWSGYNFSFEGAVFDCGDLSHVLFTGGHVSFHGVHFISGTFHFNGAQFDGAQVWFNTAHFLDANVIFEKARFVRGSITFTGAEHTNGNISFKGASRHTTCKISWGPFGRSALARKKPIPDPALETSGGSAPAA